MSSDPKVLEQEAYAFLAQEKLAEAFNAFRKAANLHRSGGNHKQASLCFAAAASCWSIKSGEKAFYNSASSYEEAAKEAEVAKDFEYASLLYKYAAINYERDMESFNFSNCFYRSRECYRKFLTRQLISPKKIQQITKTNEKRGARSFIRHVFSWLILSFSYLIWGHGERPVRAFFSWLFVVFSSAFFYRLGYLFKNGSVYKPNFLDALYFSIITFTTVGYGDISPTGFSKVVVTIELLCGLLFVPLFLIGLSRKYLRV